MRYKGKGEYKENKKGSVKKRNIERRIKKRELN